MSLSGDQPNLYSHCGPEDKQHRQKREWINGDMERVLPGLPQASATRAICWAWSHSDLFLLQTVPIVNAFSTWAPAHHRDNCNPGNFFELENFTLDTYLPQKMFDPRNWSPPGHKSTLGTTLPRVGPSQILLILTVVLALLLNPVLL